MLDPGLSDVAGEFDLAVPPDGPVGSFRPSRSQVYAVKAVFRYMLAAQALPIWVTGENTMLGITANSSLIAVTCN